MSKTSILALLTAATIAATPILAQDSSSAPSSQPSSQPSSEPSSQASSPPSSQMTSETSSQPSSQDSSQPSSQPNDDYSLTFDIDGALDVNFTFEQTVEFRRTVIETHVKPIEVAFDASVGATVPSTVTLTSLPVQLVGLYPALKGFLFCLLPDGRIVVVNPTTLKIVLIIYAD